MTKGLIKKTAAVLAALCIAPTLPAALFSGAQSAAAEEETDYNRYYYEQLSEKSRLFYDAIKGMDETGALKTGKYEYDLTENGVLTQEEAAGCVSGGTEILLAFGAARDAYSFDHPNVFYAELSQLSLSIGTKNGSYVATLGTGRTEDYWLKGADGEAVYSSAEQVEAAVSAYEAALEEAASACGLFSAAASAASAANAYLAEKIEYDSSFTGDYSHGVYGALVEGVAVCEGYARAFKAIMDELGVPCVLVQGYGETEENVWQAHMWNYVALDGKWYAVDPTWNDTAGDAESYLLCGAVTMNADHVTDGVVSSAEYEFKYPTLYAYDYGEEGDFEYAITEGSNSNLIDISVSYRGKSAACLREEGLYLVIRQTQPSGEWAAWYAIADYVKDYGGVTSVMEDSSTQFEYMQFAVTAVEPDNSLGIYSSLEESDCVAVSPVIENGSYGVYFSAPYAVSTTPSNTAGLNPETVYTITIRSSEALVQTGEIGIVMAKPDGSPVNGAVVSDIVWDEAEPDLLTFTLVPGGYYGESDCCAVVSGLVSGRTGLAPKATGFRFWRQPYVCNKVYNDGRLWMSVYGSPTPVADGDLTELLESSGATLSQMSRLLLVASKPDGETQTQLTEALEDETGVQALAVSTYEISLQLCGCITSIPEGSYMQVGFGFPDGYGPEDEGVTFQVYHYILDGDGNITGVEEVPCVVTQYGIIATVTSFSPYAIVAVDGEQSAAKSVYAYVQTGGTVKTAAGAGGVISVVAGGTVTYVFTPDNGYEVDYVLLNGEIVQTEGNELTLSYDGLLQNNTLQVCFVATSVKEREAAEGIVNVALPLQVADCMGSVSVSLSAEQTEEGFVLTAAGAVSGSTVEGSLYYEWYKDGELLSGENGGTLTVSEAGAYTVKAVYAYGLRTVVSASDPFTVSAGAESGGGWSAGAVAGVVIGSAVGAALIGVCVFLVLERRKKGTRL